MKKNVGAIDRIIRIIAGAAVPFLASVCPPVAPGVSRDRIAGYGSVGWCPPYALLGISSCKAGGCAK